MNIRLVYHSSTGNTGKLANAISDSLKIKAERIGDTPISLSEPVDLLFLGDGIYFGKPNKSTIAFIEQLNPQTVKNVAVFATYGGQAKIGSDLRKLLMDKGLNVVGEPHVCKGQSWIFMNRNHPDQADFKEAVKYAKEVRSRISQ